MFIYESTNQKTGKKYVGSCARPEHKAKHYFGSARSITADIKANGHEHYSKKVLSRHETKAELKQAEFEWHVKLDVVNDSSYLNKTYGAENYGTLGYKWTGEQSKNLSRAHKGIKRKATTKKLQSVNKKGKKPSELTLLKIRLTKLKKQVRESSGIRMRGLSYEIRIQVYGTQLSYYYGKAHDFEDVRQSLRDHARPIIKMYEEDIKRLESEEGIKIVEAPKELMTQQGFTKISKGYNAQYTEQKFGKISVKYLGNFPTKFQARMATLFYWNRLKKHDYIRSILIEDNLEYFRNKKR